MGNPIHMVISIPGVKPWSSSSLSVILLRCNNPCYIQCRKFLLIFIVSFRFVTNTVQKGSSQQITNSFSQNGLGCVIVYAVE